MKRKGIILAGGSGTRLYPLTRGISKQLVPVYDKPMIYYPLSSLMLAGIRDILVITTPEDQDGFIRLLGDGKWLGLNIQFAVQPQPNGLAEAFLIGEKFIDGDPSALVLGDNIFYGHGFTDDLRRAADRNEGATVFAYQVKDPQRYGVVEFDKSGRAVSVQEKPEKPRSAYAITGTYFYDERAVEFAKSLNPSPRGELEITDLNRLYLEANQLYVQKLGRGIAWLDTGTHESLLQASTFIQVLEQRQGLRVACVEEIAYTMGYITKAQLLEMAEPMRKNGYGEYLLRLAEQGN